MIPLVPVGARTQWEVGGPAPKGDELRAPVGIRRFVPEEMIVTLGGGTPCGMLDAALAERNQHCPLDPVDPAATVGGVVACGLSGWRRLGYGPVRAQVLAATLRLADGTRVRAGAPLVKNVTGYDLVRLVVGSLGTLGLIEEVTLRTRPLPAAAGWWVAPSPDVARRLLCATSVLWDGETTWVRLEGHPEDLADDARRHDLVESPRPVLRPEGPHRGRVSVRPGLLEALTDGLVAHGLRWLAEPGVGTVHIAAADPGALDAARQVARRLGGWLLREAGAPALDPFGGPLPNRELARRVRAAFDPAGRMNPGRLPW